MFIYVSIFVILTSDGLFKPILDDEAKLSVTVDRFMSIPVIMGDYSLVKSKIRAVDWLFVSGTYNVHEPPTYNYSDLFDPHRRLYLSLTSSSANFIILNSPILKFQVLYRFTVPVSEIWPAIFADGLVRTNFPCFDWVHLNLKLLVPPHTFPSSSSYDAIYFLFFKNIDSCMDVFPLLSLHRCGSSHEIKSFLFSDCMCSISKNRWTIILFLSGQLEFVFCNFRAISYRHRSLHLSHIPILTYTNLHYCPTFLYSLGSIPRYTFTRSQLLCLVGLETPFLFLYWSNYYAQFYGTKVVPPDFSGYYLLYICP